MSKAGRSKRQRARRSARRHAPTAIREGLSTTPPRDKHLESSVMVEEAEVPTGPSIRVSVLDFTVLSEESPPPPRQPRWVVDVRLKNRHRLSSGEIQSLARMFRLEGSSQVVFPQKRAKNTLPTHVSAPSAREARQLAMLQVLGDLRYRRLHTKLRVLRRTRRGVQINK